jgi:hypothetical protein
MTTASHPGKLFQRDYEDVCIDAVDLTEQELVVSVTWLSAYLVVLDPDGIPESILHEGAGSFTWHLPAPTMGPEDQLLLMGMEDSPGSLTETGAQLRTGPLIHSRHLHADNGVVIASTLAAES